MSAGHAGGYFSKQELLSEGCRAWGTILGVSARVPWRRGWTELSARRSSVALCRGEDPGGNRIISHKLTRDKETGERVETHRAGNDYTTYEPSPPEDPLSPVASFTSAYVASKFGPAGENGGALRLGSCG